MTDESISWRQVIEHLIHIVVPISLGMVGFLFLRFVEHEVRLAKIEASRYTIADARNDQREMNRVIYQRFDELIKEVSHIRETLARLEGKQGTQNSERGRRNIE